MSEKPDEQRETEDPSEDKFENVSDLFGHSNNKPSEDKIEWYLHQSFWTGFIGWFVGNGLIWLYAINSPNIGILVALLSIPANIIFLIMTRKMFAMGLLAAISLNLAIVLIQGVFVKAICFIPFFVDSGGFF
ncbi:MAG: hypothetical protein IH859_03525 [Chloroflexi bacterium]|nr:hypothetical protein [Chloroflexota bacterium]